MKPIVPVGASTDAWALRKPLPAPSDTTEAHSLVAASCTDASRSVNVRTSSLAA